MTGFPAAFEPSAFNNDAFQTGSGVPAIVVVDDGRTMYGGGHGRGHQEEIETLKAKRRSREREIEIREHEREQLQAKLDRAREQAAKGKAKQRAKADAYATQLAKGEREIAVAAKEAIQIERQIDMLAAMVDDTMLRRRKLILAIMAAT